MTFRLLVEIDPCSAEHCTAATFTDLAASGGGVFPKARRLAPRRIAKNPEWRIEIGEAFREGKDVGCVNGGVWQRITQTNYILEVDGQSLLVRFISIGFFGVGKTERLATFRDLDENIYNRSPSR